MVDGCEQPDLGARHARQMLTSLQWECPLGGNPPHCQLHEVRKMDMGQRMRWIATLSDDQCSRMYQHHLDCLSGIVCPDGGC